MDFRLPAVVGDARTTDKLLFIEVIAEIFGYQLHHIEIGTFYHDPFTVLADTQQTHEITQTSHGPSSCATSAAATRHRFLHRDFRSLDIGYGGLHRGFIFSHFTSRLLHKVIGEVKREDGILFIYTTDQVFPAGKTVQARFDHLHQFIRIIERTARRHRHIDIDAVGIHIFHLLHIHVDGKDQGDEQDDDRPENRYSRIPHTGFQQNQVDLYRTLYNRNLFIKDALPVFLPQQQVSCHRDEQQGDKQGDGQGRDNRNTDMMPDQLDHKVVGENEGKEDRHRRQRSRHDRTPYLLCTLCNGTFGRTTGSRKAVDIFKHHHTIVEQHPDSQCHPHQRQTVDRYTEGIEEIKCRINGYRD